VSGWALVVPVKSFGSAKSRLGGASIDNVDGLAEALAYDSIQAGLATPSIDLCVVVCARDTAEWAKSCGATVTVEAPDGGLNAALRLGRDAVLRRGQQSVAFMMADLPLLSVEHLEDLLHLAPADRPGVVGDLAGEGSTLLLSRRGQELDPRFGVGSFAAHRSMAADLTASCDPSLRVDLDTWEDLARLERPTGVRTREWFDTRLVSGIWCSLPGPVRPAETAGADFSAPPLPV